MAAKMKMDPREIHAWARESKALMIAYYAWEADQKMKAAKNAGK